MNTLYTLAAKITTTQIVLWAALGLMLIALVVFPFISRRRQGREFQTMIDNLSVGDKVMTSFGMIGTIKKLMRKPEGVTFLLETGEKTVIELDVGAIARILYSVKPIPLATKKPKKEAETPVAEETPAEVEEPKAEVKPAKASPKKAKVKTEKK